MEDDGICEHVSRASRFELASLLVDRLGSPTDLAAALGITEMAVRKWLLRLTHPSNVHLQKMLELALQLDERQACEIIERDLSSFSSAVKLALETKQLQNTAARIVASTF